MYGWYTRYKASNYLALPFSGAWVDQPHWLEQAFSVFSYLEAWIDDPTPTWKDSEGTEDY